jgi:hypothetical protein
MFARDYAGRSLEAELDASGRKTFTPGLLAEIANTDWLVTVHWSFDDNRFSPEKLQELGFERVRDERFGRVYALWKRARPAAMRISD